MLERAARLGDQHELDHLEIRERSPDVVEFERPAPPGYASAAADARAAFRADADVLYQPTFFELPTAERSRFIGFADFIVWNEAGEYEVYDNQARPAREDQRPAPARGRRGADAGARHPDGRQVHLVLGDRTTTTHDLGDIAPVYRTQRAELERVIAERIAETDELRWGDVRYSSCGRCAICQTQVQQQHCDLVLVAGMRLDQRTKLIRQGVLTIDDLADRTAAVPGLSRSTQEGWCVRRASRPRAKPNSTRTAEPGPAHAALRSRRPASATILSVVRAIFAVSTPPPASPAPPPASPPQPRASAPSPAGTSPATTPAPPRPRAPAATPSS